MHLMLNWLKNSKSGSFTVLNLPSYWCYSTFQMTERVLSVWVCTILHQTHWVWWRGLWFCQQCSKRVQPHDTQVDKTVLQSVGPSPKALQTTVGYESCVTCEYGLLCMHKTLGWGIPALTGHKGPFMNTNQRTWCCSPSALVLNFKILPMLLNTVHIYYKSLHVK